MRSEMGKAYKWARNLILYLAISACFILCQCSSAEDDVTDSPLAALVRKSLRPITRACMVKVGASESDLKYIRNDPPYPEKTACIMTCLFEKIGLVKNEKYSKNGFLTLITPLVMHNKKKLEHMRNVANTCDKEIEHAKLEKCGVGNEIVTCIFKYAPELHIKV